MNIPESLSGENKEIKEKLETAYFTPLEHRIIGSTPDGVDYEEFEDFIARYPEKVIQNDLIADGKMTAAEVNNKRRGVRETANGLIEDDEIVREMVRTNIWPEIEFEDLDDNGNIQSLKIRFKHAKPDPRIEMSDENEEDKNIYISLSKSDAENIFETIRPDVKGFLIQRGLENNAILVDVQIPEAQEEKALA